MRRYCSRCLQTMGALDPERCSTAGCRTQRPPRGWPAFLSMDENIDERFIVAEILGAGGAGITYKCRDLVDDTDIALKVLHDDRRHGVLANRLAIEGELLELLDHPHIVGFRGLRIVGDGPVYLASEYMRGGSLEGRLRRGGAMTADVVGRVGRQLALALDFIHSQGIVHRDLKPGNVLIEVPEDEGIHVRLGDFGIARVFRGQRIMPGPFNLTRTGVFIGTPEYAAPEQIRGEKGIGPAADAFALGALLHYATSLQPLLKRSDITDWDEFRRRARDPKERSRLVDIVEVGLMVGRRTELEQLDTIIDELLHPDAAARVSLADVAVRLGARADQLAPRDVLPLAPRSLVSALDEPWFEDDVDALVPLSEPDEVEEHRSVNLADLPDLAALSSLPPSSLASEQPTMISEAAQARAREYRAAEERDTPAHLVEPESIHDEELRGLDTSIVPSDMGPEVVPPPDFETASSEAFDADWEDGIDWATPSRRRRNRLHGLLVALLCVAAGAAFAWPGGPGGLVGEERLASVGAPIRGWIDALAPEAPTFEVSAPWQGKKVALAPDEPVFTSSARPTGSLPTGASRAVASRRTPAAPPKTTPAAKPSGAAKPTAAAKHADPPKAAPTKPLAPRSSAGTAPQGPKGRSTSSSPRRPAPRKGGTDDRYTTRSPTPRSKGSKPAIVPKVKGRKGARFITQPDTASVAQPGEPPAEGPIDRWADDPEDPRGLHAVVEDEVDAAQKEWLERLQREADEADARAERWADEAAVERYRREALFRAWDRQLDDAEDHRGHGHARSDPSHVVGGQVISRGSEATNCTSEEEEVANAE